MANTPLKNRTLASSIIAAVKQWRRVEDIVDPIPKVTAPRYSAAWEDQIFTRDVWRAARDIREAREIEALLRFREQQRIDADALIAEMKAHNAPPKTRKLPAWITAAVKQWRSSEERRVPKMTVTRDSGSWEDQVWTRDIWRAVVDIREARYIEECLRISRQEIIDKLGREANAAAKARHAARQAIIDQLLKKEIS